LRGKRGDSWDEEGRHSFEGELGAKKREVPARGGLSKRGPFDNTWPSRELR